MKNYFLLLFLAALQSITAAAQNFQHVKYGSYTVGFRSTPVIDYSRPSNHSDQYGRALQINVWYPAKNKPAVAMNFASYVYLGATASREVNSIKERSSTLKTYLTELAAGGADTISWRTFFNKVIPMKAKMHASFSPGDHPVILLIHGSASDYAFLGEFLASHGMIAVNVPYKGYLQNRFDVNVVGMETEIRDHEYALDHAIKMFGLKLKKLGLVGFSFGGQSAVGLAVRNKMVKGIVSLDGGIGSSFGPALLADHPFYNVEKVNMPLLHLYNPADSGGNIDWFNVCQYTDRWLVPFRNMDHSFFSSYGFLDNYIHDIIGPAKPKPGSNYEVIIAFTVKFFQELFSDIPSNVVSISGLANQNPWMNECIEPVSYRKKQFTPIPIEDIQHAIGEKGMEGLREIHQKHKATTAIPITDNSYRTLFINAFTENDRQGMLAIAELYEKDFPGSALPKYFRGRALQLNEKSDEAKEYFKKCLEVISGDGSLSRAEKEAYAERCKSYLNG